MRLMTIRTWGLILAGLSSVVANAGPVQWSSGVGGNDHWYELVFQPSTDYQTAKAAAAGLSYLGLDGHLATWSTVAEFNFITSGAVVNGQTGYWYGAERADTFGDLLQNWNWVNGEGAVPTSLTSTWFIDFFEGPGAYGVFSWYNGGGIVADYIQTGLPYTAGFVVEYDSVPEPGTLYLGGVAALGLLIRRFRR